MEEEQSSYNENRRYNKKGLLGSFIIGFIVLAITISIGITILSAMRDNIFADNSSNISTIADSIEYSTFVSLDLLSIIVIIGVSMIILGLIFTAFSRVPIGGFSDLGEDDDDEDFDDSCDDEDETEDLIEDEECDADEKYYVEDSYEEEPEIKEIFNEEVERTIDKTNFESDERVVNKKW